MFFSQFALFSKLLILAVLRSVFDYEARVYFQFGGVFRDRLLQFDTPAARVFGFVGDEAETIVQPGPNCESPGLLFVLLPHFDNHGNQHHFVGLGDTAQYTSCITASEFAFVGLVFNDFDFQQTPIPARGYPPIALLCGD